MERVYRVVPSNFGHLQASTGERSFSLCHLLVPDLGGLNHQPQKTLCHLLLPDHAPEIVPSTWLLSCTGLKARPMECEVDAEGKGKGKGKRGKGEVKERRGEGKGRKGIRQESTGNQKAGWLAPSILNAHPSYSPRERKKPCAIYFFVAPFPKITTHQKPCAIYPP